MRTTGWLRDFIIRTVWPYLGLSDGETARAAGSTGNQLHSPSTPAATQKTTQQLLFSTPGVGIDYVGRFDAPPSLLSDAALLWRGAGGEVIRSYELSKNTEDTNTWVVELLYSAGGARVALFPFAPPILITLNNSVSVMKVFPNQTMPGNSGLYATVRQGPDYNADVVTRIDGVIEMERNANLP